MTTSSFAKKYGKLLAFLAGIFAIADYIFKWLDLIPSVVAITILIIAAFLVLPVLSGIKSGSKSYRFSILGLVILFFIGLGYYFISDKSESKSKSKVAMNNSSTRTDTRMILQADNSVENANNKKNSIEINAPITTIGNSKLTIANEINNYNRLPQRHLTLSDLNRLNRIPTTCDKVQVLYAQNDKEASVYGNEIFEKLFEIGLKNISMGNKDGAIKSSKERFTIQEMKDPQNTIIIIINPQ